MVVFNEFVKILFLFAVGASFGWVFELVGRSYRAKRLINPGFLSGPALPIYGFGVVALYYLSTIPMDFIPFPWLRAIFYIVLVMIIMTAFEFGGGLIFIKGMGLKLWDYSTRKGNIMGIICPLFTALWGLCGAIYYYGVHPWLKLGAEWAPTNKVFILFLGVYYGILLVDLAFALHVGVKLRQIVGKVKDTVINWQEYKEKLIKGYKEQGLRAPFFTINSKMTAFFKHKSAAEEEDKNDVVNVDPNDIIIPEDTDKNK